MKKIILFILLTVNTLSLYAGDIKFKLRGSVINQNTSGAQILKGDEFEVLIDANGNGNISTRHLLFDYWYDSNSFQLVSVTNTGTGGNGGILPQGSSIQMSNFTYPGYTFISNTNNTTSNGTTNYSNANYSYTANGGGTIGRTDLVWSSSQGMPYSSYDRILVLRFKLKTTASGNIFEKIKLNFVASWTNTGGYGATIMETPLQTNIIMNQNYGKYITAKVDVSQNLLAVTDLKLSFKNIQTNLGVLFPILSDGTVSIDQTKLTDNTNYEVSVMYNMDKTYDIYNNGITISDFTTSQYEFVSIGLDGTLSSNSIKTGQSLLASDVNNNQELDGGDLPLLLSQVAGVTNLITLPSQYQIGSGGYMSLPTWKSTDITTVGGNTEWGILYTGTTNKILIDMRKFPQGKVPSDYNSIQIFDIYSGPISLQGFDASWATYLIPVDTTIPLSLSKYISKIRNLVDSYALQIEFQFDNSPNTSWGGITTSNWKTVTSPKSTVTTMTINDNIVIDLKYLVIGDVNRSHSSQVYTINNSTKTIVSNANKGLSSKGNTISSIDVNLSNVTVTSNTVEIPVNVNTNGNNVNGLQFEFVYDSNKLKFEELKSNLPDGWYVFANSKDGKVKFGTLNQTSKTPLNGTIRPFSIKFLSIGNGLDISSYVGVTSSMDASDTKGNQLYINLNTQSIKLTGYNKF